MWQFLPGGKLLLHEQHDNLLDYMIQSQSNPFTILFAPFPQYLCESVLGTRILYEWQLAVGDDDQIRTTLTCLTPWIEALNNYFGSHEQDNRQQAKTYVRDPQILETFTNENCSDILYEDGDVAKGTGQIELMNGWVINFERTRDQRWVIVKAQQSK